MKIGQKTPAASTADRSKRYWRRSLPGTLAGQDRDRLLAQEVPLYSVFVRGLVFRVAAVLLAASAAFLVAEFGLRMAGFSYLTFTTTDDRRGWGLQPGAAGWQREEGEAWVEISRQGLRDRQHSLAKPAGTLRIAVLGDSFAEARQVDAAEAFWAVLERELTGCSALDGDEVEVINFGVSGYSTAQELLTLRHHAWEFDPDLVLLAFVAANDVRGNSRELERDPMRPYFVSGAGAALELDASFRRTRKFRFRSSWLGQALEAAQYRSRVAQLLLRVRHRMRKRTATTTDFEPGLDVEVYAQQRDASWTSAWEVTERLIVALDREIAQRGKRLLVVSLSSGIQVHPHEAVRTAFLARPEVDDLFYAERRIERLALASGFDYLALAPRLLDEARARGMYFHGFESSSLGVGHWNADGHRLAGEIMARELCDALAYSVSRP